MQDRPHFIPQQEMAPHIQVLLGEGVGLGLQCMLSCKLLILESHSQPSFDWVRKTCMRALADQAGGIMWGRGEWENITPQTVEEGLTQSLSPLWFECRPRKTLGTVVWCVPMNSTLLSSLKLRTQISDATMRRVLMRNWNSPQSQGGVLGSRGTSRKSDGDMNTSVRTVVRQKFCGPGGGLWKYCKVRRALGVLSNVKCSLQ